MQSRRAEVSGRIEGPLESLVHYSLLQLGKGSQDEARIISEVERWLSRLEQVDPFRRRRYVELRKLQESMQSRGRN